MKRKQMFNHDEEVLQSNNLKIQNYAPIMQVDKYELERKSWSLSFSITIDFNAAI